MFETHIVSVCELQLYREHFVEELEKYDKEVEEFASFGDLSELSRYLEKSRALNAKLDQAMDKVPVLKRHRNQTSGITHQCSMCHHTSHL